MSDEEETGNPVFDYRREFRKSAARTQHVFILIGLLQWVVGGICFLAMAQHPQRLVMGVFALVGLAMFAGGIAWGFYWRRQVREEFRQKFGLEKD
jgi:hypothetical protein